MGWILWFLGVIIAVIVGLSLVPISVPFVTDQVAAISNGGVKALLVASGLLALAKVVG